MRSLFKSSWTDVIFDAAYITGILPIKKYSTQSAMMEVREEFVRVVTTGKHTEIPKLIRNSDRLLEATLNMDAETVAAAIEKAHRAGNAPMFYNNEQASSQHHQACLSQL